MKLCRVCGVEGRALCYPCQWKISAASPRHQRALKAHNADPKFKAASAEQMKKMWADPKFKAASVERMKKMHADPEFEAARIKGLKKMWADPKYKAAHVERSKMTMKKMWADPKYKAAQSERLKKRWADPKNRAAQSKWMKKTMKKMWADPKNRAAQSERGKKQMKKMYANPKFKATLSERMKKMQVEHPELRLNGYGKNTVVDGHTFPSKAEAGAWLRLRELGGKPVHGDTLPPILTPYGKTYPDTMLRVSVLNIPAGVPIEIKDKNGEWPWSDAQRWAVENGETFLVCSEDFSVIRLPHVR